MRPSDVPAVARLFLNIFRSVDKPADQELQIYLRSLALESPSHDEATGTQVYEQQDGRIRSALLAIVRDAINRWSIRAEGNRHAARADASASRGRLPVSINGFPQSPPQHQRG